VVVGRVGRHILHDGLEEGMEGIEGQVINVHIEIAEKAVYSEDRYQDQDTIVQGKCYPSITS
jgi:hypothetical protein